MEALRAAILNSRPPYCAGTLSPRAEDLLLFYGKDDPKTHGRIDFNDFKDEQLQHLAETCDKATFGLNKEDVLDESYRKAGKLDNSHFCTKLDPGRAGLIDIVRYNLLSGKSSSKPIKAELYKLNVYSKDSFFKAHKDTPRSTRLFGSLVVVLPTPHEGGELILRHKSKEWTFDSAKEIGNTRKIGYVAFFSDVEHEVGLVKSGYRVTLTYNLYHIDESESRIFRAVTPMNECAVENALRALVEDDTFYPKGTHLGFGLAHEYPIPTLPDGTDTRDFISENLKGSDALLRKACEELGLDADLYVYYSQEERGDYEFLLPKVLDLDGDHVMDEGETFADYVKRGVDGVAVIGRGSYDDEVDFHVVWVTEKTNYNAPQASWMAYGNEYYLDVTYGQFCLIVTLGPGGQRDTGLPMEVTLRGLRG